MFVPVVVKHPNNTYRSAFYDKYDLKSLKASILKSQKAAVVTLDILEEYANSRGIQVSLLSDSGLPFSLLVHFGSFFNGIARLICGGKCEGCESIHLRNIYTVQFVEKTC